MNNYPKVSIYYVTTVGHLFSHPQREAFLFFL